MIPYILHVTVLITACFLFYKLLLQKETFFWLNRWTLLACVVISFALPLVPVPQQWSWRSADRVIAAGVLMSPSANASAAAVADTQVSASVNPSASISANPSAGRAANPLTGEPASLSTNTAASIPVAATSDASHQPSDSREAPTFHQASGDRPLLSKLMQGLYRVYLFGVIVFGANFLLQIIILLYRAYARPVVRDGRFRIVETTGNRAPCSFGNNIFINPSQYDWDTYNQILLHEKIHASGRHTIDILLAEILIAGQWFNPFAWLYRKEVENNLEFLTDESVLRYYDVERSAYQLSLLKVAAPNVPFSITTNYNQSLLKRRIIMMNSKKSSLHTIWKYFFLLPMLTCLVCALNKPAVFGQSMVAGTATASVYPVASVDTLGRPDRSEGSWFATTKGDRLCFEFKGVKDEHIWSDNSCFLKSEFASLPGTGKVEFRLIREAGIIFFNGQFDGEQGFGHYSFKADGNYVYTLGQKGIDQITEDDLLTFFLVNLKNDYVDMLQHNGFPHIGKNNLIALSSMGVDQAYIQSWREMGYGDISGNDLIAVKSMGIDKTYIGELRAAGYQHLEINQLIAFKSQGIDGRYINQLSQSQIRPAAPNTVVTQQAQILRTTEVPDYPQRTVSPDGTVTTVQQAQISIISEEHDSPPAMVSSPVTVYDQATASYPAVVSSRVALSPGARPSTVYMSAPGSAVVSLVAPVSAVRAEPFPAGDIITFKSLNIDSAYIASLKAAGYDHLTMNDLIALHSLNIDAAYIKSFQAAGCKSIPVQQLPALKSLGITPEYVNGFRRIGFKDISAEQLPTLKSMGITPEYIKGFRDVGYTNISLEQLPALKSSGITPEFIKALRKIGFKDIPLDHLPALKFVESPLPPM